MHELNPGEYPLRRVELRLSRSLNLSEFVAASKRAQNEEDSGKGRGEKAAKAMAEEQRAFPRIGEAAYTVNDLQRGQ